MRIALIDCDYESGIARFPNPFLMKISSFFKQREHITVLENFDVVLANYDKVFVGRMLQASDRPPLHIILNEKTTFYETFIGELEQKPTFPTPYSLARPDYTLYTFKFSTDYTAANFLQYNNYNEVIKPQSSLQYYLVNPVNIIMDQALWQLPKPQLIGTLKKIKLWKKIHFMFPIDFSALFDNDILEEFIKIPLNPQIEQNFQNFTQDWKRIINTLVAFKEANKQINYIQANVDMQTNPHSTSEEVWIDIENAIEIGFAAKQAGVRLLMNLPQPLVVDDIFLLLHSWSKSNASLLEHATSMLQKTYGITGAEGISTPRIWDRSTANLARIIVRCPHLLDKITQGWKGTPGNIERLNLKNIQEGVNDLPIL